MRVSRVTEALDLPLGDARFVSIVCCGGRRNSDWTVYGLGPYLDKIAAGSDQ